MKLINIRFYQMIMLFFITFSITLGQNTNKKILTNKCNCKNASSIKKKIKKVKSLGYSDINNSLKLCEEIIDSSKNCCDSFMVQAIVMRSEVKQNSDIIDDSMIDELNHLLGRIIREQTPDLYFTVAKRKASLLTSFPDHFDEAIKIIESLLNDKYVNQNIKNKLFLYIDLSFIKINQNKFSDAIDIDHKMIEEGEKNSIEQFQLIGHNHLAAIYYAL